MTTVPPLPSEEIPSSRAGRVVLTAAALTVATDFLFWSAPVGASLGVFFCVVISALIISERKVDWTWRMWIALGMLAATALQSTIEISLSNVLAALALLLWFLGEICFPHFPAGWARWVEAQFSFVAAPIRWINVLSSVDRAPLEGVADMQKARQVSRRVLAIAGPALLIGGVFLHLLTSGNLMLAEAVRTVSTSITRFLLSLDLSIGRIFFWAFVGCASIAWLAPRRKGMVRWFWAKSWPQWTRPDETLGRWQTIALLGTLNLIFFAANTLDGFYLWSSHRFPGGVSASEYLHAGVGSLIFAVLLSACVLAVLFQQQQVITSDKLMRGLAYGWIAQNVFLISSVVLRLKLYVEAYQWSELRVYVAAFLALVTFGFAALTWRIYQERTLGWLIVTNFRATFALFFLLQFLNVASWVANANVDQWLRDRSRTLDVEYLQALGPAAWPALAKVSDAGANSATAIAARNTLVAAASQTAARRRTIDWRSVQLRRERLGYWLLGKLPITGEIAQSQAPAEEHLYRR